jgi:hypothetical protein
VPDILGKSWRELCSEKFVFNSHERRPAMPLLLRKENGDGSVVSRVHDRQVGLSIAIDVRAADGPGVGSIEIVRHLTGSVTVAIQHANNIGKFSLARYRQIEIAIPVKIA